MNIVVENISVLQVSVDLLVMKYAGKFLGADSAIAQAIGVHEGPAEGETTLWPGKGSQANYVLFIGVGSTKAFRYRQIEAFGRKAIASVRQQLVQVRHLGLTVHGPGYGLDLEQAFLSLVAGLVAEWRQQPVPCLAKVTVAELSKSRCEQLKAMLARCAGEFGLLPDGEGYRVSANLAEVAAERRAKISSNVIEFGSRAERQPRLFAAMPFESKFLDEFEIAFCEAARTANFICERLDRESFSGDIMGEFKRRIENCRGVLALLNDLNPNVFLEVGYALALGKTVILVANESTELPFDVRSHRCLRYSSISGLRKKLTEEIVNLKQAGLMH